MIESENEWMLDMSFERGREGKLSDGSFFFSSFSRGCRLGFGR